MGPPSRTSLSVNLGSASDKRRDRGRFTYTLGVSVISKEREMMLAAVLGPHTQCK